MCVCLLVHVSTMGMQLPMAAEDGAVTLKSELQMVVSHLIWVLVTEPRSTLNNSQRQKALTETSC